MHPEGDICSVEHSLLFISRLISMGADLGSLRL